MNTPVSNYQTSQYLEILMDYNKKINLISRQINAEQISQLAKESLFCTPLISNKLVVDAGSGNGLLGAILAIHMPANFFFLVESTKKKAIFLNFLKKEINLTNIEVINGSIQQFVKRRSNHSLSLVSRGFPDISIFLRYLKQQLIDEAIIFTSKNKIQIHQKSLEKFAINVYNIPSRAYLVLITVRNVSRETKNE